MTFQNQNSLYRKKDEDTTKFNIDYLSGENIY